MKRSDGLRIPHPKIIVGPKFCGVTVSVSGGSSSSVLPVVETAGPPGVTGSSAREACAVTESQQQVMSTAISINQFLKGFGIELYSFMLGSVARLLQS